MSQKFYSLAFSNEITNTKDDAINSVAKFKRNYIIKKYTPEEIVKNINAGKSFIPCYLICKKNPKTKEDTYIVKEQSIFAFDIDNKLNNTTIERIQRLLNSHGLIPNIIYKTHSYKKTHQRFRVILFFEKSSVLWNSRIKENISYLINFKYPQACDINCNDITRVFFSAKDSVVYSNFDIANSLTPIKMIITDKLNSISKKNPILTNIFLNTKKLYQEASLKSLCVKPYNDLIELNSKMILQCCKQSNNYFLVDKKNKKSQINITLNNLNTLNLKNYNNNSDPYVQKVSLNNLYVRSSCSNSPRKRGIYGLKIYKGEFFLTPFIDNDLRNPENTYVESRFLRKKKLEFLKNLICVEDISKNFQCILPEHEDHHNSAYIFFSEKYKTYFYRCRSCEKQYRLIPLIAEIFRQLGVKTDAEEIYIWLSNLITNGYDRQYKNKILKAKINNLFFYKKCLARSWWLEKNFPKLNSVLQSKKLYYDLLIYFIDQDIKTIRSIFVHGTSFKYILPNRDYIEPMMIKTRLKILEDLKQTYPDIKDDRLRYALDKLVDLKLIKKLQDKEIPSKKLEWLYKQRTAVYKKRMNVYIVPFFSKEVLKNAQNILSGDKVEDIEQKWYNVTKLIQDEVLKKGYISRPELIKIVHTTDPSMKMHKVKEKVLELISQAETESLKLEIVEYNKKRQKKYKIKESGLKYYLTKIVVAKEQK